MKFLGIVLPFAILTDFVQASPANLGDVKLHRIMLRNVSFIDISVVQNCDNVMLSFFRCYRYSSLELNTKIHILHFFSLHPSCLLPSWVVLGINGTIKFEVNNKGFGPTSDRVFSL